MSLGIVVLACLPLSTSCPAASCWNSVHLVEVLGRPLVVGVLGDAVQLVQRLVHAAVLGAQDARRGSPDGEPPSRCTQVPKPLATRQRLRRDRGGSVLVRVEQPREHLVQVVERHEQPVAAAGQHAQRERRDVAGVGGVRGGVGVLRALEAVDRGRELGEQLRLDRGVRRRSRRPATAPRCSGRRSGPGSGCRSCAPSRRTAAPWSGEPGLRVEASRGTARGRGSAGSRPSSGCCSRGRGPRAVTSLEARSPRGRSRSDAPSGGSRRRRSLRSPGRSRRRSPWRVSVTVAAARIGARDVRLAAVDRDDVGVGRRPT